MAQRPNSGTPDLNVDLDNLYREETFTDLGVASVRRLLPVRPDGSDDPTRTPLYLGETSVMTQMGPLPVQFPLDAQTLEEALAKFPDGVKAAIERLSERAREAMREESSRIVVPSAMPAGLGGGGGVPGVGGLPGAGGKIMLDK